LVPLKYMPEGPSGSWRFRP